MPNLEEVRGIDWKVTTLQKLMSMIDIFEMWKWQRKWFSFMSTTQLCVSIVVFGPKVRQSDNCNMILNKRFDQPVLRHCIALFYKKKTSENHFFDGHGYQLTAKIYLLQKCKKWWVYWNCLIVLHAIFGKYNHKILRIIIRYTLKML